jgi:hypothetical protein
MRARPPQRARPLSCAPKFRAGPTARVRIAHGRGPQKYHFASGRQRETAGGVLRRRPCNERQGFCEGRTAPFATAGQRPGGSACAR